MVAPCREAKWTIPILQQLSNCHKVVRLVSRETAEKASAQKERHAELIHRSRRPDNFVGTAKATAASRLEGQDRCRDLGMPPDVGGLTV